MEWTGNGYEPSTSPHFVFFTETHVDLENEVVRRALASAIQREGLVFSLGNGYGSIDNAHTVYGYCGYIEGERELTLCDEEGETEHGDTVERAGPVTWVELK
jgi:ABC-type transport system substrate-binding protein